MMNLLKKYLRVWILLRYCPIPEVTSYYDIKSIFRLFSTFMNM